jgi:hypothetical protein
MSEVNSPIDVPEEVQARVKAWHTLFMRATYSHYAFGILGVAASAISAATDGGISKALAAVSAICIAVLGFAQPDRKYVKFVRAWRILDVAALRYRYGKITLDELLEAVEHGEQTITDFEQDMKPKQKTAKNVPRRP